MLNQDAQNAETDKDRGKIDKKVVKVDEKIGKEELKIDDDIQKITKAKIESSKNNLELVKESLGDVVLENSTSLKQSNEFEAKANDLIIEAIALRLEAASEKDKTKKAELAKKANSKEVAAVQYYDNAADLYVDAAYQSNVNIVKNNVNAISSEDFQEKANEFSMMSASLSEESIAHADSALTAKGDEKMAMLQRAERKELSANSLRAMSTKYQTLADDQKIHEDELANEELLLANLSAIDIVSVKSNEAYPEYLEKENAVVQQQVEKAALQGEKVGVVNILKQQEQDLKGLENQIKGAQSAEKTTIANEIEILETAIEENETRVGNIDNSIVEIDNSIAAIKMSQEDLIANNDEDTQADFEALMKSSVNKTPIKKTAVITFDDLISSNFIVPDKVESNIYANDNTIKYSDDNPIHLILNTHLG